MERTDLNLDSNSNLVSNGHDFAALTKTEFSIFSVLYKKFGQLVTREELLYSIDGFQGDIQTRTIDVHISSLRRKIGALGPFVFEGVYGKGYRLTVKDD